ncbi:MAG: 6-bladed beta-propeller [Bacteroidia bacterium]|nr:6-bladed beta-propeller [Bacteroidia bacterium]
MKKGHIVLFIIMTSVISSCKSPVTTVEDLVTINIPDITKTKVLLYSEVYDNLKLIPLETKDSSLIGSIDKIVCVQDRIFILDTWLSKSVLQFDMTGKFICRAGRFGKGPGEYDQPDDLSVDWIGNNIILYIRSKKALQYFDLNGKFIKEVPLDLYFTNFSFISENRYAVYLDNDINSWLPDNPMSNLIILNNKKEIEFSAFPFDRDKDKRLGKNQFLSATDSELLVSPAYSDTIYSYHSKKLIPKYRFDFGEHNLPASFAGGKDEADFYKELRKSSYAHLSGFMETPDYLVFSFIYKSMVYSGFYSFRTKQVKFGNIIINDLNGLVGGRSIMAKNNNDLVTYFDPSQINYPVQILDSSLINGHSYKEELLNRFRRNKNYKAEEINSIEDVFKKAGFKTTDQEIKYLRSINENDNPIILLLKMKKF